jgi:membrane fusion protein, multidrug efflux system
MKSVKFLIPILALTVVFACKQDKKAELAKLKKQYEQIGEKIKALEQVAGAKADTASNGNKKTLRVAVTQIQPVTFNHYIEVQGRLDGEENVDVYPEGMGAIKSVLVKNGQAVSAGQALARLDDGALNEQLKGLKTNYNFAKETFEKQQRLWEQKIGSEVQYLQTKATKESLEAQIAGVQKQISMMTIKSPIDGTVEDVPVKVGQTASPQVVAFRVMNFGSLKVKADVAEAYAQKVNVGDNVLVFFPDLNKEVAAKITSASRYINTISRTFQVEVHLNTDKNGYKSNMIAILKINDYKADKAITVQVNYIQSDLTGNFVFVVENKENETIAQKVYVKQGQSYNGLVEITNGLKPGDTLITSGYLDLENGEAIKF